MVNNVLPYHGQQPLELAILSLSSFLFAWVSLGFWTAVTGFLCCAGDAIATPSPDPWSPARALPADARTAVVMPICNEAVARVFAGLRATYESVAARRPLEHFDFFVLSDSTEPDTLAAERHAWRDLLRERRRASAASSTAGAGTASSARAATSPTSAAAGAASTATWSSWTPTA